MVKNIERKKLLFISHPYHVKTKSADFLVDLLKTKYDVTICIFDIYSSDPYHNLRNLKQKNYDILVIWQIFENPKKLKKYINFNKGIYFPMYDNNFYLSFVEWLVFKEFNIINFSETLHKKLQNFGFSSFYIKYFPKPAKHFQQGDEHSCFFWQRTNSINIELLDKLFKNYKINTLYYHKAIDPGYKSPEFIPKIWKNKIEYSEWYKNKEDLTNTILKSAIYIAPRTREGIGMSFLEAMAAGRYVIAVDKPTMNEYITDGVTGKIYDFSNPQPLIIENVKQIQFNTYNYMKNGYKEWETNKYQILEWIEQPVIINKILLEKKKNIVYTELIEIFGLIIIISISFYIFKKYKK